MKTSRLLLVLLLMVTAPFSLGAQDATVRIDPSSTLQPALRKALLHMAQREQRPLDAQALATFKSIISQYGWPTVVAAGRDGVDAAGALLLQSRADYDFQNDCLLQVFQQVGVDTNARAALVLNDRIEHSQGHPQQGGMLFTLTHGKVMLLPPSDPMNVINGFRGDYGLPPVTEDLQRLQTAVDAGASLAAAIKAPRLSTTTHPIGSPSLRAELGKMALKDQAVRNAFIQSGMKPGSPEQAAVIKVDAANLARLKGVFQKYGFPNSSQVGHAGVGNAWLLVQHASSDKPFMAKALKLARPLMLKGELARGKYALLVDRVRLQQGKKQVYGSQLRGKPGHFVVLPLEDPAHVDQRRAKMGLEPLADYLRETNDDYTPKSVSSVSPGPAKASTTSP